MMNIGVMLRGGSGYLFIKTPDEIWNFFGYLAYDTWEYDKAREIFSHPIPDPYMVHATSLNES